MVAGIIPGKNCTACNRQEQYKLPCSHRCHPENARTNPTMNTSLKNYIHNFARKISKEYDLNIDKTLWIELDDKIRVASLNPDQKLAPEILYSISWRPIRPKELKMIKPYITDM